MEEERNKFIMIPYKTCEKLGLNKAGQVFEYEDGRHYLLLNYSAAGTIPGWQAIEVNEETKNYVVYRRGQ